MRWIVHSDIRGETRAIEFCKELLGNYDTRDLDWVRMDLGRGRHRGAYGRCWYPAKGARPKGYRISVQVPGPFPYLHRRYVSPIYQRHDGSWPSIPPNTELAGFMAVRKDDGVVRRWQRLTTCYAMETMETAIVHIFAHEAFHFLRKSRQIAGRNSENEADQFALSVERHFHRTS